MDRGSRRRYRRVKHEELRPIQSTHAVPFSPRVNGGDARAETRGRRDGIQSLNFLCVFAPLREAFFIAAAGARDGNERGISRIGLFKLAHIMLIAPGHRPQHQVVDMLIRRVFLRNFRAAARS